MGSAAPGSRAPATVPDRCHRQQDKSRPQRRGWSCSGKAAAARPEGANFHSPSEQSSRSWLDYLRLSRLCPPCHGSAGGDGAGGHLQLGTVLSPAAAAGIRALPGQPSSRAGEAGWFFEISLSQMPFDPKRIRRGVGGTRPPTLSLPAAVSVPASLSHQHFHPGGQGQGCCSDSGSQGQHTARARRGLCSALGESLRAEHRVGVPCGYIISRWYSLARWRVCGVSHSWNQGGDTESCCRPFSLLTRAAGTEGKS